VVLDTLPAMVRDSQPGSGEPAALLVVAHPDDETLWLQPWLSADSLVVVAFPDHPRDPSVTAARETIRESFPVGRMEFLPLHSVDVVGRSDWRRRSPTPYGVALDRDCPSALRKRYVANHAALCELLAERITPGSLVYTHNPWGEYGHEEHVQVCRAVLDVASVAGASVWAWDGLPRAELARSSMRLRADYYEAAVAGLAATSRTTDRAMFQQLKDLYQRNSAWTWRPDYEPPEHPRYIELMHAGHERIRAARPRRASRAAGIFAGHVRRSPHVARRLVTRGRLRAHR
jgi:LmbE family N-acetylglucosaminyl deacetylase